MSLLGRLRAVIRRPAGNASGTPAPASALEPAAAVELEYQRQLQTLEGVRRSIVEVLMTRKRLESQANQMRRTHEQMHAQASAAVAEKQDDLARSALAQALDIARRLKDRQEVIDGLRRQERELEASGQKLQAHIEDYRARMETARARHAAAEAEARAETMAAELSRDTRTHGTSDSKLPGTPRPRK